MSGEVRDSGIKGMLSDPARCTLESLQFFQLHNSGQASMLEVAAPHHTVSLYCGVVYHDECKSQGLRVPSSLVKFSSADAVPGPASAEQVSSEKLQDVMQTLVRPSRM